MSGINVPDVHEPEKRTGAVLHAGPYRQQEQPRLVRGITLERFTRFTQSEMFSDVNLYSQFIRKRLRGGNHVRMWVRSIPDLKRVPFDEAVRGEFKETSVGSEWFGPTWSTHWFRVEVTVPKEWRDEDEVQYWFDAGNEAMVWSEDGTPLQGLTGGNGGERHVDHIIPRDYVASGKPYRFYVEMACNGLFGAGINFIGPPDENRQFYVNTSDIVVPNRLAWSLYYDFQIIRDAASNLPADSEAAAKALKVGNDIVNAFVTGSDESLERGRAIAQAFLGRKGSEHGHQIIAVGHCHIDSAWLWPYDETKRKAARSWSTQIDLMDRYPEYKFVCSQAQQFAWVERNYPKLFERIRDKVKSGQFLPLGSTWVEMDCNVPSGESLCRQFLFGQRYYESRFGKRSKIFWLPDTFGYSAQLPQIMQLSGAEYFFTQKLSWNNINKFPNTTFHWAGLDGTKVLTHMAPSETYAAQGTAYSEASLLVFGNGDGGGGPLAAMIERLRRMENVEGIPRVRMGSAEEFYEYVDKTAKDLCTWKGELYFELHRGTYTSQASIKRSNRTSEMLLRDVELFSCLASLYVEGFVYPREKINHLWEYICSPPFAGSNQFHDVLPGSSIELVYKDAKELYKVVADEGMALLTAALDALYPKHGTAAAAAADNDGVLVLNPLSWARSEVVAVPNSGALAGDYQVAADGTSAYVLASDVPSMGHSAFIPQLQAEVSASVTSVDSTFLLENAHIRVTVDSHGHIIGFYDIKEQREVIPDGSKANVFVIYEDQPLYWDVEIYHLAKGREIMSGTVSIHEVGPLRVSLLVEYEISPTSRGRQLIVLYADSARLDFENEVDWDENRQLLKVEFPVDIHSDYATYETQFGYVQRPTHYNTSWDYAKFEVCVHKFADLSEHGYGVTIFNDSKYGFSTFGNVMRLTLLKAPKGPDDHCDIGRHEFRFAMLPHRGTFHETEVVRMAHEFNSPLIARPHPKAQVQALGSKAGVHVHGAHNVVLETVKRAEDSEHVVVRLHEAYGGHGTVQLAFDFPVSSAHHCNILEDDGGAAIEPCAETGRYPVKLRPFQIVTLKLAVKK
ncbi:galactose mutarotase-like domain-containing protein [Syncephalis pseudoplumigaleata]|uniref:Alpha-mannosidase n=1 Tax=Syncephalis pseudoplumigaleata TaxID=1712513 RepID=A0A4P9Z065_9FUNG|nr:galactose mutarotase-like domain-containing protein [Syncephalis pseudoplumigaleata]|eukprot:RKP25625.1 galactose mutarotase-like domain-containing protein [Syncephalis pseudoplumigaleata]